MIKLKEYQLSAEVVRLIVFALDMAEPNLRNIQDVKFANDVADFFRADLTPQGEFAGNHTKGGTL